jgi:putative GTP pyrophosphokinase
MEENEVSEWYSTVCIEYGNLSKHVSNILESLLRKEKIQFHSISSRTKSKISLEEKIQRKGYANPKKECHDIAGIRIITFIESDNELAANIVKRAFNWHPDKSLDKLSELGDDRFGYRSIHFVCDLGEKRLELPEFQVYKDLLFEIQIRSILQHAWAEIQHDRGYKLSFSLPLDLKRKMNSIAGMLEIADREFNSVASYLESYKNEIGKKEKVGELIFDINSASLFELLSILGKKYPEINTIDPDRKPVSLELLVDELKSFGLSTLEQVKQLLSDNFLKELTETAGTKSWLGVVRTAMMLENIEKYFEKAWKRHWDTFSIQSLIAVQKKYDKKIINRIKNKYGVNVPNIESGRQSDTSSATS